MAKRRKEIKEKAYTHHHRTSTERLKRSRIPKWMTAKELHM